MVLILAPICVIIFILITIQQTNSISADTSINSINTMSTLTTNPQSCTNPSKLSFLDDLRSKYPHQPVFLQVRVVSIYYVIAIHFLIISYYVLFKHTTMACFYCNYTHNFSAYYQHSYKSYRPWKRWRYRSNLYSMIQLMAISIRKHSYT